MLSGKFKREQHWCSLFTRELVKNIKKVGLLYHINAMDKLILLDPLGYLDFIGLMSNASFVMTDSGGIQEETTILGVPCMTLRENIKLLVTIEKGTNRLSQINAEAIIKNFREIRNGSGIEYSVPDLLDGKTAESNGRIMVTQKPF